MAQGLRSLVFGAAALLCLAAPTVSHAEPLQKVRALIPVKVIDEAYSPFTVAKYLGYYKEEGLDVELLPVGGSNEVSIQVSAGNADIGAASPAEALIGMQSGALKVQYFYDLYYRNIWSISVPEDSPIKDLKDLRGKKLGVQSMGSGGITFAKAFATSAGLDPQKDISFLPVGVGAQAIMAVRQHMVDAIVFWDSAVVKFGQAGLKLRQLATPPELASLPDVSLLAQPATIQKHPKMLVEFARAVAKAYDFSMQNPEAAVMISWKVVPEAKPANVSPADAIRNGIEVNQSRLAIWNSPKTEGKHGLFIAEDWQHLVDFALANKILPAPVALDRIYTNALVDQINQYDRPAVLAAAKAYDPAH